MDVLGYSVQEIAAITEVRMPAVKSSLHRGRTRLRELAKEPEDVAQPALSESEHYCLPRTWIVSMRATSRRSATCSPMKSG